MLAGPPETAHSTITATSKNNNKPSDAHAVASAVSVSCAPADKAGWLRRFCGKRMFREIWKKRFVVLAGHRLTLCEKEGRAGAADVLDLCNFAACRDASEHSKKSASKKDRSKFTLQRCCSARSEVASLLFLAPSPEDKDSWIAALNVAIARAKNKVLDQVTAAEAPLRHPTRARARMRHGRRPPSRGHLLALASSSDGTVTLDRIGEPEASPPSRTRDEDWAARGSGRSRSLPRQQKRTAPDPSGARHKNRRASAEISWRGASSTASVSLGRLRRLIGLKVAQTERLLEAARERERPGSDEDLRAEARGLLRRALETLETARQVLREVKELRELHLRLDRFQDRAWRDFSG